MRVAVMLEAIYAWRRNGGMRWPSYERSDAIMDLRAASRNSNSQIQGRPPYPSCAPSRSFLTRSTIASPPYHLHNPLSALAPLQPRPDLARSREHRAPAKIDHRLRERSEWPPLFGQMHFTTFAISARREDTSFTHCLSFRPGVTGTPLAPPDQAPNGVLLTTGSVAQSPGVPCPRLTPKLSVVFRSLDPKGNVRE